MNKSIIGIVIALLVLAGGFAVYNNITTEKLPPSDPGIVVPSTSNTAPIINPKTIDGL